MTTIIVREGDCSVGAVDETTDRQPTAEELAVIDAQNVAVATQHQAEVAAEQALADTKASGITHALSLGFNQAQAEAMFP